MKSLMLLALATLTLTSVAATDQKWLINLGFGPSVPQNDVQNRINTQNTSFDPGGQPTRISGGEKVTIDFVHPDGKNDISVPVDSVRLLGFSKSGQGAVLIRAVTSKPKQDSHFFDPILLFGAVDRNSKCQAKDGNVLLGAGDSVFLQFPQPVNLNNLAFTMESFGDNDASVVVQLIWHGASPKLTERITRQIINPPVYNGGGGSGGGSWGGGDDSNSCAFTVQCRGDEHCMNGQCVPRNTQACAASGIFACGPGENCCGGVCQVGTCN